MTLSFRRLATGRTPEGKSVLVDDARVEEGTLGNFNFWTIRPDGTDGAANIPFFPPPGGSIFRVFRLPPGDPPPTASQLASIVDDFFKGVGSPGCRVDTSRHPLMHVTPTTDYIMLLSGEVSLLLDVGEPIPLRPFDCIVQRATNHAWVVTGSEAAVLVAVMSGVVAQESQA
jgi:hypothetical protein